jgi:hypothetical protein
MLAHEVGVGDHVIIDEEQDLGLGLPQRGVAG